MFKLALVIPTKANAGLTIKAAKEPLMLKATRIANISQLDVKPQRCFNLSIKN